MAGAKAIKPSASAKLDKILAEIKKLKHKALPLWVKAYADRRMELIWDKRDVLLTDEERAELADIEYKVNAIEDEASLDHYRLRILVDEAKKLKIDERLAKMKRKKSAKVVER